MKKRKIKFDWARNLFIFVLVTLVGSVAYAIAGIATAPPRLLRDWNMSK